MQKRTRCEFLIGLINQKGARTHLNYFGSRVLKYQERPHCLNKSWPLGKGSAKKDNKRTISHQKTKRTNWEFFTVLFWSKSVKDTILFCIKVLQIPGTTNLLKLKLAPWERVSKKDSKGTISHQKVQKKDTVRIFDSVILV